MKLTVTQNINKLNLQVTQNNTIVKLQPILNSSGFIETDPIFQASEASLFVAGDKANLDNQSGINSGDETTSSIQTKRPLKTINNESLEGTGNVQIDYNDLDNLPTIPIVLTNHSELTLDDGTNPHGTTKSDVGLSNADNTSDVDKPIGIATQNALNNKADLVGGKVPASQLPFYVDDVIEGYFNGTNFYTDAGFTNLITPESGKIYINIAVTPATQYRWSGSSYVLISDLENGIYNNESRLNVIIYQTTFQSINYSEGIATSGSATYVAGNFIKYTSTAQTNQPFGYRGNNGVTSRSNSNKRYVFWFSKGEIISGNFLSVGCNGGSGMFTSNFGGNGTEAIFGHGASDVNFKLRINGVYFDLGAEFPISTDFYRVSFLFRDGNVICDVKNMTNGKKTSITHSVPTNVVIGAVHLSGGTLSTSTAASLLIHRIKIINYEN